MADAMVLNLRLSAEKAHGPAKLNGDDARAGLRQVGPRLWLREELSLEPNHDRT
jgi:hypothetical protein